MLNKFNIVVIVSLSIVLSAGFSTNGYCQENTTQSYGFLHFIFNVDTAFVQLGMNKPVIKKVANGDTLKVKNGFYHIYLSYPTNEDTYVTQNVLRDSLYTVQHDFDLTKTEIDLRSHNASIRYLVGGDIVVLTDSDTDIVHNDSLSGTEFGALHLNKGKNRITFRNPEFYPKTFIHEKQQNVTFFKYTYFPQGDKLDLLSLLPGISQLKRKEYVKTGLLLGSFLAANSLFMKYQKEYSAELPDYLEIRQAYNEADNERTASEIGDVMEAAAVELKKKNLKRNLALWGILSVIGYDLYDKVKARKRLGYRKENKFEFFLEPKFEEYISLGARLKL